MMLLSFRILSLLKEKFWFKLDFGTYFMQKTLFSKVLLFIVTRKTDALLP